jgi:hypothetical protein
VVVSTLFSMFSWLASIMTSICLGWPLSLSPSSIGRPLSRPPSFLGWHLSWAPSSLGWSSYWYPSSLWWLAEFWVGTDYLSHGFQLNNAQFNMIQQFSQSNNPTSDTSSHVFVTRHGGFNW